MATDDKWGKLIGVAEMAMGVGFFIRGIGKVKGAVPTTSLLGRLNDAPSGKGSVIKASKITKVRDIDERVSWIKRQAIKASVDPKLIEEVSNILGAKCGDKWCVAEKGGKDGLSEVKAFFWALRDPKSPYALRYKRDHLAVDTFINPVLQQKLKNGDCDDGTARLAAWLMQAGYQAILRVVHAKGAPGDFSHIYVLAGVPAGRPTRWVPLDWSVLNAVPGWEAPGARELAATGRPSGVVDRLKDYPIGFEEIQSVISSLSSAR